MAPSHYLKQCWIIVNWTLRNKLQGNFNRNSNIFIQENALEHVVCEMEAILSRPQCVKAYVSLCDVTITLWWRHNRRDAVSNHQPHDCFLNCLFRSRSHKISKFRVTGLCEGNPPVAGGFPSQRASTTENGFITKSVDNGVSPLWEACKVSIGVNYLLLVI